MWGCAHRNELSLAKPDAFELLRHESCCSQFGCGEGVLELLRAETYDLEIIRAIPSALELFGGERIGRRACGESSCLR